MKVFVGSLNPVKISAVEEIFLEFFPHTPFTLQGISVPSEVPDQPIGLDIVVLGAVNRAKNAKASAPSQSNASSHQNQEEIYYVGIEAGFIAVPHSLSGYLDYQFCAILDEEGHLAIGSGSGCEFPPKIIQALTRERDSNIELKTIMAELSGDPAINQKDGAVGYYSGGKITRKQITKEGVRMALLPLLNKQTYFSSNHS